MNAMNRVLVMGHLTHDPQVRQTPTGRTVCDLGLAITERRRNGAGETVETTCFVDIIVWEKQAQACGHYLKKGRPILIEGRLQQDRWANEKGEKSSRLRVVAERVHFLSGAQDGGAAGTNSAESDSPTAGEASSGPFSAAQNGAAPKRPRSTGA